MFESLLPGLSVLESHPYTFLFFGLLVAGETILLPAIYFALAGRLSMPYVILIAMIATSLSDLIWYYIGIRIQDKFFKRFVGDNLKGAMAKLSTAFERRSGAVLYFSKFVYGTRIAAQVLSGVHKMTLRRYLSINFLGVFSLTLFIVALAYFIETSLENFHGLVHNLEIAFLVFVIILVIAHLVLGAFFKKTWSR